MTARQTIETRMGRTWNDRDNRRCVVKSNIHDIEVQFQHQTDAAVCVRETEDGDDIWLRDRVMGLLRYDAESGKLFWKVDRSNVRAGSEAGYARPDGYRRVSVDGRDYFAHRIVWLMTYGRWPTAGIDHIDGDPANNRIDNLRKATQGENHQNRGVRSDNVSGFTGVGWLKKRKKWQARICLDGKEQFLGYFDTAEDAAEAYAAAKRELHTFHPDVVDREAMQLIKQKGKEDGI